MSSVTIKMLLSRSRSYIDLRHSHNSCLSVMASASASSSSSSLASSQRREVCVVSPASAVVGTKHLSFSHTPSPSSHAASNVSGCVAGASGLFATTTTRRRVATPPRKQLEVELLCWKRQHTTSTIPPFPPPLTPNEAYAARDGTELLSYDERRIIGYTPEQIFDVVADVRKYPEFLPWCDGATVHQDTTTSPPPPPPSPPSPPSSYIQAELVVGFRGLLSEQYTSHVHMRRPELVRQSTSDSRLFKELESQWSLEPVGSDATKLRFAVRFGFQNALYQSAAELFFAEVVEHMVAAFEQRCATLYGPPSRGSASSNDE